MSKKPQVIILVGIIGSGKSTYAATLARLEDTVIVNKDQIRTMLKGEYVYSETLEHLVKTLTMHATFEALHAGYEVVIDETNFIKIKRLALKKWLREKFPDIYIKAVVFPPGPWCLDRRLRDPRGKTASVWRDVYNNMTSKFEPVTEDEGFDEIMNMPDPEPEVITPLLRQREFCSKNGLPYLVPGESCLKCGKKFNDSVFLIENSASMHITSCPWCYGSFTE